MTADQDRVEAALRAYWGEDDLDHTCSENWFREKRARIARALAAADALVPPPVSEDVRQALQEARDFIAHIYGQPPSLFEKIDRALLATLAPPANTGDGASEPTAQQATIDDMEKHRDQDRRDIIDLASRLARVREALEPLHSHFETSWASYENSDPMPRHEIIGKVERIVNGVLRALAESEPA